MEVTVELTRKEKQPLGIFFRCLPEPPFCQVAKLHDTGAATASGEIHMGDILLNVNGHNVEHLKPEEVKDVLKSCVGETSIRLALRRTLTNGQPVSNGPSGSPEREGPAPIKPHPSPSRTRRSGMALTLPGIDEKESSGGGGGRPGPDPHHRLSLTPEIGRKSMVDRKSEMLKLAPSKSVDFQILPQWRQRQTSEMVPIQNLLDGHEMSDRLHNHCKDVKFKDTGCHPTFCKGSHMWPKDHRPKRPFSHPRSPEEVLPLAEDFIKQYFQSKKHALGERCAELQEQRMVAVRAEVAAKGSYDLTYEELVFGARMAWRNAPRCSNRIVWRQLEVLDARHAQTPKDMYDAIIHHMEYANNGGNLRSTITVFPHRSRPKADFRVWNSQLVKYAGYKRDDGSILGDPSGVEFTDVCVRLGWNPPEPRGRFDVLPLVLQADGGEPEIFTIPPALVIEVQLSHPDYPWFKELGLRWYALPAVSNILLDCGGVEFPAAPFSGWYMQTEIGRDLTDVNRYNVLKPVAHGMGLNLKTEKMWKDRALIEVNVSILHSFQKANVSIADHHSVTESFITHMKAETQARGGCPADWVWIVPPISGSITPVFHQEMLLYYLTPSYEYQDDPWNHHHFPSQRIRERSSSVTFKMVAKMVQKTARMYSRVYQKRVKATILYATETGRSRNYANTVKEVFGQVFAAKVVCMEDYDLGNLEQEQLLVVVTSTFGSGDPPCNGEGFGRYLIDVRNKANQPGSAQTPMPRSHRMSTLVVPTRELLEAASQEDRDKPLTQVRYAVFGLGSRAYPNFCTFAHTCDNLLKDLGAQQLYPCGEGDELCGQEETFQAWLKDCYLEACDMYKLDPRLEDGMLGFKPGYTKEDFRVCRYYGPPSEQDVCKSLNTVHGKQVHAARVKCRSKLQSTQSDRSTILVVLDSNKQPLDYEPGDHIAIYPCNSAKLVSELVGRLKFDHTLDEPFTIERKRSSSTGQPEWLAEKRFPVPVTLREAFTHYLDFTSPPSPQFLKLLALQASKMADREELEELSRGGDSYEDWKYGNFPNLIDVLDQFHSLKVDVTFLLQQMPLLQCRYYSISSSPKMHPGEIHATVAVVSFKKKVGSSKLKHHGVCSTWLNRIEPGTIVPCFIRKANTFHLPSDPRTPIIMVGPGTGIAPFRSFWQQRMHQRSETLRMQLMVKAPSVPKVKVRPAPETQDRRRRKTAYAPPKLELLEQQQDVASAGGILMRRSASDQGDTLQLAKMLAEKQKAWGNMSLFFGCRRSDMDHIYKEEMMKAHITGALSEVHVGLSREPGKTKTYVQHLLQKNADSIVRQLLEEAGHFYVCGDISMAADVTRTLQNVFEEYAAMSPDEARRTIESMKEQGLYHEDIFGVTLKTAEVTNRIRNAARRQLHYLAGTPDQPGKMPLTPTTPHMKRLGSGLGSLPRPSSPRPSPSSPRPGPPRPPSMPRQPSSYSASNVAAPSTRRATIASIQKPRISAPLLELAEPLRPPQPPLQEVQVEVTSPASPVTPPSQGPSIYVKVPPQASEAAPPQASEATPPQASEVAGRTNGEANVGEVKKRGFSGEKKKVRRIRTGSKIETEI